MLSDPEETEEDRPPTFSGCLPFLEYDSDHLAICINVKLNTDVRIVLPLRTERSFHNYAKADVIPKCQPI